ncbi:MAG: PEP-CTERM sorting domain-containing protein, partial [Rhodobacteraceae bacterium]|nr:PEP-CTERM sorting domain-containing protein [Paracoccaceae bacterium]
MHDQSIFPKRNSFTGIFLLTTTAIGLASAANAQDMMTDLDTLVGGTSSKALGVSADGAVVVGESGSAGGTRAFRWESGTGMVDLGTLTGGNNSKAAGVSADGSVIVGQSNSDDGWRAFRWDAGSGMVSLGTLGGGR